MKSDLVTMARRYRRRWFLLVGIILGGGAVGAAAVALFLYRRSQRLRYYGSAYERGPLTGYPQWAPPDETGEDDRSAALRRRIEETRERLLEQMEAGAPPAPEAEVGLLTPEPVAAGAADPAFVERGPWAAAETPAETPAAETPAATPGESAAPAPAGDASDAGSVSD